MRLFFNEEERKKIDRYLYLSRKYRDKIIDVNGVIMLNDEVSEEIRKEFNDLRDWDEKTYGDMYRECHSYAYD